MKKLIVAAGLVMAFGFAHAEKLAIGETNADGEYRPNLSAETVDGVPPDLKLDTKGYFTLKANAKWVVYDEDLDVLNARTDVNRLVVPSTATFIFDNTTQGTTKDLIFWNSSGTFIKRGPSTMVVTGYNYRWVDSKIYINEGTWEQKRDYTLAGSNAGGSNFVYVAEGAAIRLNHDSTLSGAVLHIRGTGVNGGGALIIDDFKSSAITRLILDDDALLTVNADGHVLSGYTNTGGAAGKVNPAELTLNGHTLTIGGTSTSQTLYNLKTFGEDGGSIVVSPRAGGFTLTLLCGTEDDFDNYDLSHITSFTLPEGSTVKVSGYIDGAITPDFNFIGNATLVAYADRSKESARNLTGAISIPDGKTLTVTPTTLTGSRSAWAFNLRGPITGGGNLAFGTTESPANGSVYLWNTNAYTGTTTVNGQPEFKVYACAGRSIPSVETLAVNGGSVLATLTRDPDTGDALWNGEDLLAFYRQLGADRIAPYVNRISDASSVTVTPAQVAAAFPGGVTWGATGAGAGGYTLTGPYTAVAPLDIAWSNGTLRLTGPDTITLGSAQVAPGEQPIGNPSTLVIDDATVVFGEDGLNVGSRRRDNNRDSGCARLIVSNSTLSCSVEEVSSDIFNGTLFIGRSACGTLEVEDGAVISNRLVVGGGGSKDTTTSKGAGRGVVLQRGGTVFTRGTSESAAYTSNVGGAGEGYYELSGGELKTSSYFSIGTYQHGTFLQLGGTATYGGSFLLAYSNGGYGHYTVLGGTTKCRGSVTLTSGTSGEGFLTVSGPQAQFDCSEANYSRIGVNAKTDSSLRTTINLNDRGTLTTTGFYVSQLSTLTNSFIINFNGGVLRHDNIYGNASIFGFSKTKDTPKVVVYEKGLVLDSNGTDITTEAAAITAEKTGGIQSIDLAAPVENCYLPPEVYITSDTGFGASATALIDSRTHTLTNILVTSRGWGYTAQNTTVKLRYGKNDISDAAYAVTPTFGDNDVGGLTKRGEGTMTVKNANAWEKWTRIEGGTLLVGEAGAVPNGTALTLSNGATLDFGGFEPLPTFTGLDGTGGTAANGAIVVTGPMTVSAKAFVAQSPCAITGTVNLSGVTSLTLTDADVLTEEMKALRGVSLISASELVLPDGGLTLEGVPEGWHASVCGNRIRLAPDRGALLLVR